MMSDTALTNPPGNNEVAPVRKRVPVHRPAVGADLGWVHDKLMEAIETSPHYTDEFKAYEKARLTHDHLAALVEADPWHVMIFERDGHRAAFMISGPELGTLWLYWSYVLPEFRRSNLGVAGMRCFVEHWENGRFHKVATYTRPGNDVAEAIMKRYGYALTARLEKHIFGEDFLLYERPLTKIHPGHDRGIRLGLKARLRRKAKALFRR